MEASTIVANHFLLITYDKKAQPYHDWIDTNVGLQWIFHLIKGLRCILLKR